MYDNNNESKTYPLPLKVKTQRTFRMFMCGLLAFVIACGMVVLSYLLFENTIEYRGVNELDDSIFSIAMFIVGIYMFHRLLPYHLIVDDEKLQIDRKIYKRTFYWNEISGLYTSITAQTYKGRSIKKDNLQVIFCNRNDKRMKLNIGIPWELEYKSETIKNTIWYAYSKYHPECRQGIE
ncbi:MAG: hypothetical protein IKU66_01470 [Clostridia bacterium]|nr:hypothetical protein [Clostridia bacterium]